MSHFYFQHIYWDGSRKIKTRSYVDPGTKIVVTEYYDKYGYLALERWHTDAGPHRIGGPAEIAYSELHGKLSVHRHSWWEHGKIHRVDGPARIHYYQSGKPRLETWMQHNTPHRIGGPAELAYADSEEEPATSWHVYGFKIDQAYHDELAALSHDEQIERLTNYLLGQWTSEHKWNYEFLNYVRTINPKLADSIEAAKELAR